MDAAAVVWPRGDELLICVTTAPGQTARCECGRPLCTPRPLGALTVALDIDYLVCPKCYAHVIVRVEPESP